MGEGRGSLTIGTREEEGHILISFLDEGPGIKTPIESIYDLFHTTKKDGTGFGLFRAQRVLKAHQGSIFAKNRPGQGALFMIKLPIQ
jgi:signal transduction histidine kinase